jgi:flagellar biosynthesis protein FliP
MTRKYLLVTLFALPVPAMAQHAGTAIANTPNPIIMVIILGALALAPFAVIMLTSFVKISVVLSILRNALGTQAVPPSQVITGLAFVLSFFIMSPVVRQMYSDAGTIVDTRDIFSEASVKTLFEAADKGKEPLRRFLTKHAHDQDRLLFIELATRLDHGSQSSKETSMADVKHGQPPASTPSSRGQIVPRTMDSEPSQSADALPPKDSDPNQSASQVSDAAKPRAESRPRIDKNDFQVLIPSFVTSQLKEAFEIGFLVFIPFVIIDMVVANVLLAMGMSMLSPSVISLPFKLLLFVLADGWFLIVRGLVLSYV